MKKAVKITSIVLAAIIGAAAVTVGGYVGYVALQYYRIEDNLQLEITGGAENKVAAGGEYSVTSYNLGFGAYSPEYTFFMDTGVMTDGTKTQGTHAKGLSLSDVQKNVAGQIAVALENPSDFYFFQETDEQADRSYGVNMREEMTSALSGYESVYAQNFHTAYFLYPFNDPIGKSESGILTLSRYQVENAVRRSFPVTTAFIDKLFDLDRCFSMLELPVEGSDAKLVLINLHMSAYDEGGTIRAEQLAMLNAVLQEERKKGNYVVAGGDFNHCLIADQFETDEEALTHFASEQQTPDWVKNSILRSSELAEGYSIATNAEISTCRGADIPYEEGVTYTTVIDGFLVSDNLEIVEEYTIDTGYAYSDHNPVRLTFRLL